MRIARELVKVAYNGNIPTVLDPFSGGGSIPLEAGRLGCQAIANDYNPVAYLILRATCEFPQKYGKPGKRKVSIKSPLTPLFQRGESETAGTDTLLAKATPKYPPLAKGGEGGFFEEEINVSNVLVHDIEHWANWILARAKEKIGHLYPTSKDGKPVVGYLWARTAPCSNTTCKGEMPVLRSLLVCNKQGKKVALTLAADNANKTVSFGIAKDKTIMRTEGPKKERGSVICPYCKQPTSEEELRIAGQSRLMKERLTAVIVEGKNGKDYREVEESDLYAFRKAADIHVESPGERIEEGQWNIKTWLYGMKTWGSLFNPRQLVAMQTFIGCLHEAFERMGTEIKDEGYSKALAVYLGLWISRIAQRSSNMGIWNTLRETLEHPFGRQAIPMTWDYPEANPFSESTGGAEGGIDWMKRVILNESGSNMSATVSRGDSAILSFSDASVDIVVTDPPYFDAIAYADLSDYFYVWLKRALGEVAHDVLITPLTPKSDEATALKHRHGGNGNQADSHFKTKLSQSLAEARRTLKKGGVVSVMFAHQSTKAWSALISALFEAGLTIDATWPIDTERTFALKASMSSLSSSITVICRPRTVGSAASFKDVRKEIERVVQESVKRFWGYGFRGADPNPPLIDALHHALLLWKEERRSDLVAYLFERGLPDEDPFWKLAQALFEVLPHDIEDWKFVHALLGERETLRTEAKRVTNTGGLF